MAKVLAAVSSFLVFNTDGSVNWERSSTAIRNAVEGEIAENRGYDTAIEQALDRLFDKIPAGTGVRTPLAVQAVSAELCGGDIMQMTEFSAKVEDYLNRSGRFVGKRGRSGGLFRVG